MVGFRLMFVAFGVYLHHESLRYRLIEYLKVKELRAEYISSSQ